MTRSLHPTKPRRTWSADELATLKAQYANTSTRDIAKTLGMALHTIYRKANKLGLQKSPDFLATDKSGRMFKGGKLGQQTQFKPGLTPWNKGTHYVAGGRSALTRFQKGQMSGAAQHNYVPIGSVRITKDGYLERKVTDDPDLYPAKRWRPVHRLVWEAVHGPIPRGHMIVYRPGQKTCIESEITVDRLECISKAENARRNHPNSYSPELAQLCRLQGAITRQVNRIQQESRTT